MRLTRAGEYAVRCIAFLTVQAPGSISNSRRVATRMRVPAHFLTKIAKQLERANLIEIIQGAKGGLRLARPAAEITMLDVVEAIMGPISLNDCVLRPDVCQRSPTCPVHRVWQEANEQLRATLAGADFASMINGDHCMVPLFDTADPGADDES